MNNSLAFLALLLSVLCFQNGMADYVELRKNPFQRQIESFGKHRPSERPEERVRNKQGAPVLKVTATLIADQRPMAMVNGRLVSVGQSIKGARLLKIEEGAAYFLYQGRQLKYRIHSKDRKNSKTRQSL